MHFLRNTATPNFLYGCLSGQTCKVRLTTATSVNGSSSKYHVRSPQALIPCRSIFEWSHLPLNHPTQRFSGRSCWSCKRTVDSSQYLCECGKIQPMSDEINYFSLLGYSDYVTLIDPIDLSNRMRAAQRQLHPDKFGRLSAYEQSLAATASSAVNKAYATLVTPVKRFEYILSLYDPEQTESSTIEDSEFLFEILELNEKVEQLINRVNEFSTDSEFPCDLENHVVGLFRQVSLRTDEEQKKIASLLSARNWPDAKVHLSRYRYFLRVLEQLHEDEVAWKIIQSVSATDKSSN